MAKKLAQHGRRWFAFLLCRTCQTGFGLDVDRLLKETPPQLFEEWRALYDLEPWDAERTDEAVGQAVAELVVTLGGKPLAPAKYMPHLRRRLKERPQTEAEMKATVEAIAAQRQRMDE